MMQTSQGYDTTWMFSLKKRLLKSHVLLHCRELQDDACIKIYGQMDGRTHTFAPITATTGMTLAG